jgi:ABC-2 type transport system permease protein
MSSVLTVARKELRTLFHSPVALLFLGVFELVTLFTFFQASRWFARNIADVRPLFEWLPLLLVFLTAAVTMRQWAEERKVGTLEVLLTLPVRTVDLVLGKFVAATALVALALALTLPLPMMVWFLGPIDIGPVIGGYVGALLLGALYVSIGLCVSARTDNQVVSLMVTLLVGGALYLVGSPTVTALFDTHWTEVLSRIGTGSRFSSIERGVLDLRDLVYYLGLTVAFLALNVASLESDRLDPDSARGRATASRLAGMVGLVAANAVAAIVWLTPVTAARLDLTEGGEYSISSATHNVLAELDEPLFIDGYFSERTHPLLSPLVPQIRDLLAEYEIAGRGRVTVKLADPNQDADLEQEIAEQYGIRSVPFQVDDAHQQAVVNSYFHLLVRYGDKYEVLSFDNLIEFYADSNGPEVKLKNLEYDLTRTIKRVSQDFSSVGNVMADLPEPATLTAYVTRASLPTDFAPIPDLVKKVADELAANSGGKFSFQEVDPGSDPAKQEELFQKYGVRPLALDVLATQTFYLDLVLTMGDKVERLAPRGDVKEADLQQGLEAALKRLAPGQLTTLGVLTEQPDAPPPNPQIPPQFQPPPPQPDYQALQELLGEMYQVQPVDGNGGVPETIDVLLVAKPGRLTDEQLFAIDQYLMRGGRIIALAAPHKIAVDRSGLSVQKLGDEFNQLLATWGVKVGAEFVLDEQNAPFPRPVQERRGGFVVQRIELDPYPFFPDIRQDGFERGHPAMSGLVNITVPWASPLELVATEGVEATVLAKTSAKAWTYAGTELDPPAPGAERKSYPVVIAEQGTFPSWFAGKQDPTAIGGQPGRVIEKSLPDARLVVLGSSEMVSDILLQLASSPGGELHRGNLQLIQNLVDWSTEDTDLLEIRSAGAFARTLPPMEEAERRMWEYGQYFTALALLLAVAVTFRARRAAQAPLSTAGIVEAK